MKKFAFGFACVLAGCAAGAAMPRVTAQTFAPNPSAQRWQQFCERMPDDRGFENELTAAISAKGSEGWELVGVSMIGVSSPGVVLACYKRPAP